MSVLKSIVSKDGEIATDCLAKALSIDLDKLASLIGVPHLFLVEPDLISTPQCQIKLNNFAKIMYFTVHWSGSALHACTWYCTEPLAEFGGITAEQLFKQERYDALMHYFAHLRSGGYA
ncbi:hypothetical protein [Photobacterium leiognathi]|uniref:hypothetical protein n=1 Tax=Photobacterium leiognathi TaxID=553611 RepID=UPI0029810461|nr:hypothetical protein [Photobacterium leiognathi]